MNYKIRKSKTTDLDTILRLRDEARQTMLRTGNKNQWTEGHPAAEVFANDIDHGNSYLIEAIGCNGQIEPVATFAFIPGPDQTYATIYDGKWLDDTLPYHVVHRIASTPSAHGVMDALLQFCFAQACNIRIDTHRDNHIMRHLLEKHGFSQCGIIHLQNGDERLAFQKTQRP